MKVEVIFWRDIPTQIVVGTGREKERIAMTDIFMKKVDMIAMKEGITADDAYLNAFHRKKIDIESVDAFIAESKKLL